MLQHIFPTAGLKFEKCALHCLRYIILSQRTVQKKKCIHTNVFSILDLTLWHLMQYAKEIIYLNEMLFSRMKI